MKYTTMARRLATITIASFITLIGAGVSQAGTIEDGIVERIQAVGTVCIAGEDCAKAVVVVAAGPKSAKDIYQSGCAACHSSGAAGAPKIGNAADWEPRIALGIDSLYATALNGRGGMPARGLCPSCSDDEIKSAVDHMIEGL